MAESLAYRDLRRRLLPSNPYFQRDLLEARRTIGLPEMGFDQALQELGQGIPRHPVGLLLGKPDLTSLKERARRLGLPLGEWLAQQEAQFAQKGLDFQQLVEEMGWGALGIWGDTLVEWWVARERQIAGLGPLPFNIPAETPLDPRLPSSRAALWLTRHYRLGDDYARRVAIMILGCPHGGGEADVEIEHRRDEAGLKVTLPCVRYDCTLTEWRQIFIDSIQPVLFQHAGKLPSDVPHGEAVKEAQRRARPGRPPYDPEILIKHLRMWRFCSQHGYLDQTLNDDVFDEFLDSLSEGDRNEFEIMDLETFRRSVDRLDRLMRPTGSDPDFRP